MLLKSRKTFSITTAIFKHPGSCGTFRSITAVTLPRCRRSVDLPPASLGRAADDFIECHGEDPPRYLATATLCARKRYDIQKAPRPSLYEVDDFYQMSTPVIGTLRLKNSKHSFSGGFDGRKEWLMGGCWDTLNSLAKMDVVLFATWSITAATLLRCRRSDGGVLTPLPASLGRAADDFIECREEGPPRYRATPRYQPTLGAGKRYYIQEHRGLLLYGGISNNKSKSVSRWSGRFLSNVNSRDWNVVVKELKHSFSGGFEWMKRMVERVLLGNFEFSPQNGCGAICNLGMVTGSGCRKTCSYLYA
ncbi:hypothetical protein CEXT_669141 [Caerostris extrusa]|uniref:Uncharacterized protein n=1 Tax=Caerostris extrusa TaxID=172846 RepID=A0AAV4SY21_CAEEX|nr:hypothetical protein CEXT_669141 [Caerostris extrusa]